MKIDAMAQVDCVLNALCASLEAETGDSSLYMQVSLRDRDAGYRTGRDDQLSIYLTPIGYKVCFTPYLSTKARYKSESVLDAPPHLHWTLQYGLKLVVNEFKKKMSKKVA